MAKKKKTSQQDDAANKLLTAVGRYVKRNGGDVLVAGPIGLIPIDKFRFHLTIQCTGRPPKHETK